MKESYDKNKCKTNLLLVEYSGDNNFLMNNEIKHYVIKFLRCTMYNIRWTNNVYDVRCTMYGTMHDVLYYVRWTIYDVRWTMYVRYIRSYDECTMYLYDTYLPCTMYNYIHNCIRPDRILFTIYILCIPVPITRIIYIF